MVCFIWLAELSFFESAWSSLILKSHPDFLEPSYPSGYRGREEGTSPDSHPLTTFCPPLYYLKYYIPTGKEEWYGFRPHGNVLRQSETQKHEVIHLLHTDVLVWETSRRGYASLRLKSRAHSSMNCKHPPELIILIVGFPSYSSYQPVVVTWRGLLVIKKQFSGDNKMGNDLRGGNKDPIFSDRQ